MNAGCEQVQISRALSNLIQEARLRGFWLYRWGRNDDPALLALVKPWPRRQEVDVVLLRQDESSTGYRTLYFDQKSLFRPEVVCWQYHHEDAEWVFRAIYTIPEPDQPGAPNIPEKPRPECHLPDDLPEPLAMRPLGVR